MSPKLLQIFSSTSRFPAAYLKLCKLDDSLRFHLPRPSVASAFTPTLHMFSIMKWANGCKFGGIAPRLSDSCTDHFLPICCKFAAQEETSVIWNAF